MRVSSTYIISVVRLRHGDNEMCERGRGVETEQSEEWRQGKGEERPAQLTLCYDVHALRYINQNKCNVPRHS